MKNKIFKNRLFRQASILVIIDCLYFGLTNPNKINSIFLIAGFILFGLSLYVIISAVMTFLKRMGWQLRNRRRIAIFSVGLICLLIALQSIGQLSTRDVLIIIPLTILLYIYTAYIRPRTFN